MLRNKVKILNSNTKFHICQTWWYGCKRWQFSFFVQKFYSRFVDSRRRDVSAIILPRYEHWYRYNLSTWVANAITNFRTLISREDGFKSQFWRKLKKRVLTCTALKNMLKPIKKPIPFPTSKWNRPHEKHTSAWNLSVHYLINFKWQNRWQVRPKVENQRNNSSVSKVTGANVSPTHRTLSSVTSTYDFLSSFGNFQHEKCSVYAPSHYTTLP